MKKIFFLFFLLCTTISCEEHTDTSFIDNMVPAGTNVEQPNNSLNYKEIKQTKKQDSTKIKVEQPNNSLIYNEIEQPEEKGTPFWGMFVCVLVSVLSLTISAMAFIRSGKKNKKKDEKKYSPKQQQYVTDYEFKKEIENLRNKIKKVEGNIPSPATPTPTPQVASPIVQHSQKEKKKEVEVEVYYFPTGSDGRFRDKLSSQTGEAIFRVTQKDKDYITFEPVNFERIRTMGGNKDSVIELEKGSCSWMEAKDMKNVVPGTLRYSSTPEGSSYWKVETKIKLILIK